MPLPPETSDGSPTLRLPRRRVRVNVTCEGLLVALNDCGAVVQLPRPPQPHTQTTLAVEGGEGTEHLPARVLSAVPQTTGSERTEYRVALEFLGLSSDTAAAVQRILHRN